MPILWQNQSPCGTTAALDIWTHYMWKRSQNNPSDQKYRNWKSFQTKCNILQELSFSYILNSLKYYLTKIMLIFHLPARYVTDHNKAIRDGRPRPPRHQVGWDIPLHFDTNPESLRPFVPEIWPNNVFNLSATYDLDLWPKILKIFVSHGVPIRNMYAKFHNDRLRNGWDITLWNFAKTRTNKHTNTHTNKQTHTQTDMGITIPRPPPMGAR